MPLEVGPSAVNVTTTGQPVVEPVVTDTTVTEPVVTEPVTTKPAEPDAEPKPVTVDIHPEALRQITALSAANRKMKQELAALQAKASASVTPEDVTAKLAELASLKDETPVAYLKRTGKTLEDIAAAVLADEDKIVNDPRVDAVTAELDAIKKRLEAAETNKQVDNTALQQREYAQRLEAAKLHIKNFIDTKPERWTLVAADPDIATEVIRAATIVIERDFKDKDGKVKELPKETADSILADCLDQAEIHKLAEQMVKERKNVDPEAISLVKRKGLEVEDSTSYQPSKGSDGKGLKGAPTPKVTLDSNRGPMKGSAVKRGPTDVRTARLRMLRIAGADVKDE